MTRYLFRVEKANVGSSKNISIGGSFRGLRKCSPHFRMPAEASCFSGLEKSPDALWAFDKSSMPDEAMWADRLRKDFDPEIAFEIREYPIGERLVVAVTVDANPNRPIICKRDVDVQIATDGRPKQRTILRQGAIYYRQSGQTRPIFYTELQVLLKAREDRRFRSLLRNMKFMQRIGPERVGVVDVARAAAPDDTTSLYVSNETARSLNLIQEGRFVERKEQGSPAYFVAANVQLRQVIVNQLEDDDRNLPTEAANQIRPIVHGLFGTEISFTAHHLTRLARHLGLRRGMETDARYCIYDNKFKRFFYTRAGVQHLINALKADPNGCLPSFAAKKFLDTYIRSN